MLATQSLATMAAYSLPAVAPAVARDLGVPGALVGVFISTVYGVGIGSALLSPAFIARYGAVRVSQLVLLATLAMLLAAAAGSVVSIALGAVLLGLAYGATAPAAAHLLVPRTPDLKKNVEHDEEVPFKMGLELLNARSSLIENDL
jgi:MFS family permease